MPRIVRTEKEMKFLILILLYTILELVQAQNCPVDSIYQPQLGVCIYYGNRVGEISWSDSENDCTSRNGQLLSIHNAFENALISQLQQNLTGRRGWLGAYKQGAQWLWTDGTKFDYQNFRSSNDSLGDCLYLDSDDQLWKAADCSSDYHHLCVVPQPLLTTTPITHSLNCSPPDYQPLYNCLQGWQVFQESYYILGFDQQLGDAEKYCADRGAQLASIHSEAENRFVTQMCCLAGCRFYSPQKWSAFYLIGATYKNGNFTWLDGSPWDYEGEWNFISDTPETVVIENNSCSEPGVWIAMSHPDFIDYPYFVCKRKTPP